MPTPAMLWWFELGGWLVAANGLGMIYPANVFILYTAEIVKRVRVGLKVRARRQRGRPGVGDSQTAI